MGCARGKITGVFAEAGEQSPGPKRRFAQSCCTPPHAFHLVYVAAKVPLPCVSQCNLLKSCTLRLGDNLSPASASLHAMMAAWPVCMQEVGAVMCRKRAATRFSLIHKSKISPFIYICPLTNAERTHLVHRRAFRRAMPSAAPDIDFGIEPSHGGDACCVERAAMHTIWQVAMSAHHECGFPTLSRQLFLPDHSQPLTPVLCFSLPYKSSSRCLACSGRLASVASLRRTTEPCLSHSSTSRAQNSATKSSYLHPLLTGWVRTCMQHRDAASSCQLRDLRLRIKPTLLVRPFRLRSPSAH